MKLVQLFSCLLFALVLTGCWNTGRGEKIGMITKLAKQGAFGCPTWEAEIVRGGFSGGTGVNGQSFHFTIEDEKLVDAVKQAMESQQEVKITYHSEAITICRSDSDHFLASIESIGSIQPSPITKTSLATSQPAPNRTKPVSRPDTSGLDRQRIADAIIKQNNEVLRQNQQLIDLLK